MPKAAVGRRETPIDHKERSTLGTLNSFAVDLISIPNTEDLFWYVAQNVVGRLNFVDCVIYRADDEQTSLVQVAAWGEKNPFGRSILNPMKIPFGQGITGQVAHRREPIIIDDLRLDQNYIEDTQRACSEICVPIVCNNRVVGVIDSEHPKPGAFGPSELEVLTTIAAMTSAKLELLAEAERSNQRYHDLVAAHAQLSQATTSQKALEAELYDARKLETVGRLTGCFAHEFNNLLTVISGNLELLDEAVVEESFEGSLSDARQAAGRAAELIQSMLTYSQRAKMSPEPTNLNALVSTIVKQDLPLKSHSLELALEQGLNAVNIDRKMFKTAFRNLVLNARDAMPTGGKIRVETKAVRHTQLEDRSLVTRLQPGDYIRLSVHDDGPGVSADIVQQIFDPFYTTKPIGSGTGLGLSLILGFMQQSGGTVAVQTDADQGSIFHLYFPAKTSNENLSLTMHR